MMTKSECGHVCVCVCSSTMHNISNDLWSGSSFLSNCYTTASNGRGGGEKQGGLNEHTQGPPFAIGAFSRHEQGEECGKEVWNPVKQGCQTAWTARENLHKIIVASAPDEADHNMAECGVRAAPRFVCWPGRDQGVPPWMRAQHVGVISFLQHFQKLLASPALSMYNTLKPIPHPLSIRESVYFFLFVLLSCIWCCYVWVIDSDLFIEVYSCAYLYDCLWLTAVCLHVFVHGCGYMCVRVSVQNACRCKCYNDSMFYSLVVWMSRGKFHLPTLYKNNDTTHTSFCSIAKEKNTAIYICVSRKTCDGCILFTKRDVYTLNSQQVLG